jgi:pyruvate,water dikinase
MRNQVGQRVLRKALGVIEPGGGEAVEAIRKEPAFATPGQPEPATILGLARFVLPVVGKGVVALWRPEASRREMERSLATILQELEGQEARAQTLAERLTLFETMLYQCIPIVRATIAPRLVAGLLMMNRVLALAGSVWEGQPQKRGRALEITRGLPHNVTTEMDLALWATVETIRSDPTALSELINMPPASLASDYLAGELSTTTQTAVDRFLQRYGMRGLAEIDLGRPRWRDDPTPVMQTLQSYAQIHDPNLAPDAVFRRGAAKADEVIDELAGALRAAPRGQFYSSLVQWMAQRMRALAGLRESPKFLLVRVLGLVRQMMLSAGAELVQAGKLNQADDIFFLHLAELKALAAGYQIDWPALVAERRALQQRERRRRQIPRVLLSDGRAFYDGVNQRAEVRAGVLVGSPVSPGVVEGTVRVVFDPHHAQLAPGEILVCPGTDPSWTPLFLAAGGLIMEVGGLMTHGSVVAREYGIPAVVGVHEATSRLHSGQRVRVDGTHGEITVLDEAAPGAAEGQVAQVAN